MKSKKYLLFVLSVLIIVLVAVVSIVYQEEIYVFYRDNILKESSNIKLNTNEYYKDVDYKFVQIADDFIADDRQDILNIIYTYLNSGSDYLKFFCSREYLECVDDITVIANDEILLSSINNFVHPYNSFKKIFISYTKFGDIELEKESSYTNDDIVKINNKVDTVIKEKLDEGMTIKDKIRTIHDYIINNAGYGTEDIVKKYPDISYNKATGVLFRGYGHCGSYSDAMSIFLFKLGIDNFKVSTDNHVWNLVKYNNSWWHLDVTWDDPVTDGDDRLEIYFFLIDNDRLKELDAEEHNFDINVFPEGI